jgi:hypothetical protein
MMPRSGKRIGALCASSEHALHDRRADANSATDLQHAHAIGVQLADAFFHLCLDRRPAERHALLPCPRKPGVDTFLDDAALELGEHAEHLEHRLACAGRGVETLLMQEQVDALLMQVLQNVEQIGERATEPIDRPGRDQVELFRVDV